MGRIDEAKKNYLNLISKNPENVKYYYGLYSLDIKNINSKIYNKLQSLINKKNISLFDKSLINFIFSKIEKKKRNLDNEINFLEISHRQCYESNISFNNQSNFYYKNIISNQFNKIKFEDNFEKINEFNNKNHLFIIGLPRSGSSLVETIIAHNAKNIISVGEFHGINTSILEQINNTIYSKNFNLKKFQLKINEKEFQKSIIEKYDNHEKNIYLDKSLENFFNIEIILNFFPNAKFIHTFRNLNDAIIGIYQTMLPELSWSHTINDIYDYINIYKKTIKFFKKKYPSKIIDVDLEKLSNKKELEVKKILKFCNIDIVENFLDYDKNENLFNKTNSFLQVRNKIKPYENNKYHLYYSLLNKKK
tara:strand:+ start:6 stop:1094 length:1089 start_codon:yes stop_codon:yes gene_type:complete